MSEKNNKLVEVTILQEFSISENSGKGPRSIVLKPGEHKTVAATNAYYWVKRGLAVEGKITVAKKTAKEA